MNKKNPAPINEFLVIIFVFTIIVIYTYAFFFKVPYLGFLFNSSSGRIEQVYISDPGDIKIKVGDQITRLGSLDFERLKTDKNTSFFTDLKPGDVIDIEILRNDFKLSIFWEIPGINNNELSERFTSQWWIAYVFLIFGTIAFLRARPKNTRQLLLVGFNYLTAIWIIAGAPSSYKIWGSPIVLRIAVWFCVPVYWHFHHKIFAQLEEKKSDRYWFITYLLAGGLGLGEILNILPYNAFYIGFVLSIVGSLIILILHAINRSEKRRELGLLTLILGLVFVPILLTTVLSALDRLEYVSLVSFLFLLALPGTYFYIIFRRQMGSLELRTNQFAILYIYGLILFTVVLLLTSLVKSIFINIDSLLMTILFSLITGLLSILIYPHFEKWAELKLLNLPLSSSNLLETYSIQITTSLDQDRLVRLLREQILPTLFIRQAALMRLDENLSPRLIFEMGININKLPTKEEIELFLNQAKRSTINLMAFEQGPPFQWVRLVFPLEIQHDLIGLLLIGRRDPDDYYAPNEILILRAITNQTALALRNIDQANSLSALYQNHLRNQENESNRLAHELHDEVLGQLAMVMMNLDRPTTEYFDQSYRKAVERIRSIIEGLRPALLYYGLYTGLQNLVEEIRSLAGDKIQIDLQVPYSQVRYPSETEFHLYRIAQQACNNTLEHAEASSLIISGKLEDYAIELNITDNGKGFETTNRLELSDILAKKHFGLAGMYERAVLIGAKIQVNSSLDKGTQVTVTWNS
jgi:signal transduction histidine kinase